MKKFGKRLLSFILTLALILAVPCLSAQASTDDEADPGVIKVLRRDIDSYGFLNAVQRALNEARELATDDMPVRVVAPAGSYDLTYVLRIYDNTTLDLSGVTLKRTRGGNMLRVGSEDGESTGAVGYQYRNIRLIGGTFDGNFGENTIIKAFHTKGFTMEGVTLLNEENGHMMEFAGVDGLTVRGCTFRNQEFDPKTSYGYEVIQLDVLHPFHITNGRCEDLPMTNVLIEHCHFEDVPRGIGSHTAVHNRPHNNIVIRHNTFKDIKSIAIQGMGWTNADISCNTVTNAPRGITVYHEPDGCTYLPSKLAALGKTTAHASDKYIAPSKSNINISCNILNNIGYIPDKYEWYSSQGIAVLGRKLTSVSPVDKSDGSGGLPAGDYYLDGVSIHDNYIDIRGNGIRIEDARNVEIRDNEILCSKNTVVKDNFYGIVLRDNVTASAVSYNTIRNSEMNAIQLDGRNGGSVNTVQYNRIEGSGGCGIASYSDKITDIYDNDIMNTADIGLFIDSTVGNIKWNRIRDCSVQGIWLTSKSSVSQVESNTTLRCGEENVYNRIPVKNPYSSSAALTKYYIPRYFKTAPSGARMGVGRMFKITPDVRPTNALASFKYQSSNSSVVRVDSYGMVYALREGGATVTVTSGNGIRMTYDVVVEGDGEVVHLEKKPTAPTVILGDADGSGKVDAVDPTVVQRASARIETPYGHYTVMRGDADSSGALEIVDATLIQMYLVGVPTPYRLGRAA